MKAQNMKEMRLSNEEKIRHMMKQLAAPDPDPLMNLIKALFWTVVVNPFCWLLFIWPPF